MMLSPVVERWREGALAGVTVPSAGCLGFQPLAVGRLIDIYDLHGVPSTRKIAWLTSARTATVRDLSQVERWLVWLARWADRREGESVRFGVMFVMGYREGSFKPWWSPSVALWRIAEWL